MDSIDNIGNVPSYSSAKGVSAYNGINNIVNQLNRDNPNSFENQFDLSTKTNIDNLLIQNRLHSPACRKFYIELNNKDNPDIRQN